jgi:hypothetical protein
MCKLDECKLNEHHMTNMLDQVQEQLHWQQYAGM